MVVNFAATEEAKSLLLKEVQSAKNGVASLLLVVTICFFMTLFYMVNHSI